MKRKNTRDFALLFISPSPFTSVFRARKSNRSSRRSKFSTNTRKRILRNKMTLKFPIRLFRARNKHFSNLHAYSLLSCRYDYTEKFLADSCRVHQRYRAGARQAAEG